MKKLTMALMLIGMIGCKEKEGKTITNTIEGPKRCCRQVSQEYITAAEVGYGKNYWNGDRLDSIVSWNNKSNNRSIYFYVYQSERVRESRLATEIDGKRILIDGYTLQTVDECGNVLSQISYDKNGKETYRSSIVYKCD
jgi:hypothetical protein